MTLWYEQHKIHVCVLKSRGMSYTHITIHEIEYIL